jgi:hypothetical protein
MRNAGRDSIIPARFRLQEMGGSAGWVLESTCTADVNFFEHVNLSDVCFVYFI